MSRGASEDANRTLGARLLTNTSLNFHPNQSQTFISGQIGIGKFATIDLLSPTSVAWMGGLCASKIESNEALNPFRSANLWLSPSARGQYDGETS